jgi:DNA polymerase-3 subunit epsilon
MSKLEVKVIKGGWKNVPDNLLCRTDLLKKGLVPKNKNKPVAVVWNGYNWINLYHISDCRKKIKPTPKQLEALKKGREKLRKKTTCSMCGENYYFLDRMRGELCISCAEYAWQKDYRVSLTKKGKECFAKWFSEDILILDTETTGLNNGSEIIELAIIDKKGNVLFDSLFKPKNTIPDEVTKIHGITNNMVADAPTWQENWNEIMNVIGNKRVLIYNAEFDTRMILSTNAVWGIKDSFEIKASCVMKAFSSYVGSERWISLSDAIGEYTSHRALDDCFSVLHLLEKVWSEIKEGVPEEV